MQVDTQPEVPEDKQGCKQKPNSYQMVFKARDEAKDRKLMMESLMTWPAAFRGLGSKDRCWRHRGSRFVLQKETR